MQEALRSGTVPSREELARALGKRVEDIPDLDTGDEEDTAELEDPAAEEFRARYHHMVAQQIADWHAAEQEREVRALTDSATDPFLPTCESRSSRTVNAESSKRGALSCISATNPTTTPTVKAVALPHGCSRSCRNTPWSRRRPLGRCRVGGLTIKCAGAGPLRVSRTYDNTGALGVNTTGIDSSPLTKFAGRSGNADSSANRRSGSRRNTRSVIIDSSSRAS